MEGTSASVCPKRGWARCGCLPLLNAGHARTGFAVLGALVTLHELSVANTAAGDASLATWGALTQLTRLNLDCTAVTNTSATLQNTSGLECVHCYAQSCGFRVQAQNCSHR